MALESPLPTQKSLRYEALMISSSIQTLRYRDFGSLQSTHVESSQFGSSKNPLSQARLFRSQAAQVSFPKRVRQGLNKQKPSFGCLNVACGRYILTFPFLGRHHS